MIDIRKLKELVRLMVTNDLSELDLRDEQQQVTVKRGGNQAQPVIQQVAPAAPAVAAPAAAPAAVAPPAAAAPEPAADDGLVPIESPMVGTFYAKPNPEKPNFVSVGDSIGPDSVVCLIEAMKIFNEIKAERSGTVAKVLVENGDAVEFGQPLLLIKPE
ncbi:MAG: acetyl-CoA carboxylase biotin carboxyl carrier protein [Phycisphaeraceae bacterium]|nr:acetyl-CoA carboxylase biotin carboxyl carrier protein [Phycisphaeraceae bacterium]MCP4067532.1 acetyl-CoA carboxylase biotin carboxyl carrier protein [Phycisphaeraceae bacterium]MCP4795449.1 acetyl-CoA carboxylase biotin carboxyl carrier protein [Phycisphaeraceae bacterium]